MDADNASLRARVAELERAVAELQRGLAVARQETPPVVATTESTARRAPSFHFVWDGEFWLNRLGIGLLLFGLAFLFKLSVDQGWITPWIRVAFGAALGSVLLVLGLRLDPGRHRFTPVLLGGGIATFYIVGFAAFQLYGLVAYPAAFTLLLAVTLLALGLAVREDDQVLVLVGALCGLGTPFLLYTSGGSFVGLVAYTCFMLAWTGALFAYRGWRLLYWTAMIGGWTVFALAYVNGLAPDPTQAVQDRWLLQAAILYAWALLWTLPLAREVVLIRNLGFAPYRVGGPLEESHPWDERTSVHFHLLSLAAPLAALLLSRQLWALPNTTWGGIVLGTALLYLLAAGELGRWHRPLANAQLLAAATLGIVGLVAALRGNVLLLALAAEGTALHLVARRTGGYATPVVAHALWAGVALWLIDRLAGGAAGLAGSLSDLGAIALGLIAAGLLQSRSEMLVYRYGAHLAFLAWMWGALEALPNGTGYVTIAWGAYAVALMLMALRQDWPLLQRVAVGTLLLVVAKLFLVDLGELEALWRILLFLGLGAAFLFLSYSLQNVWKSKGRARA
ncbi:hypothetical protein BH24GEM2_BH24GEM2_05620 [soil metagenome]